MPGSCGARRPRLGPVLLGVALAGLIGCDSGPKVYPVRPAQCRTWPFWESNVESPEAWERTKAVCPGSGRGQLIPAEEVTLRVKVVKL